MPENKCNYIRAKEQRRIKSKKNNNYTLLTLPSLSLFPFDAVSFFLSFLSALRQSKDLKTNHKRTTISEKMRLSDILDNSNNNKMNSNCNYNYNNTNNNNARSANCMQ